MKLARKFTFALVGGILCVHVAAGVVRVRREIALFHDDVARDERVLGKALAYAIEKTWSVGGLAAALGIVEHATERQSSVRVRWVWLDAPPGSPDGPRAPAAVLRSLALGSPVVARLGDSEPELALYTYFQLNLPDERPAALEISDPLAEERDYLRRSIQNASIATVVLVALCALVAWGLGSVLIGRPVRALVEHARRVGRGDLASRVEIRGKDELGELGQEMNQMCGGLERARDQIQSEVQAKLSALEQLRHADRLTTVGTLASGIAHELGTPINVIDGHAQLLVEGEATLSASAREHVAIISKQCRRMAEIIRQLLDFARKGGMQAGSRTEVGELARATLRMLEPLARRQNVTTELVVSAENPAARIPPRELQQVLTNILINGLHAMPNGGDLRVRVSLTDRSAKSGNGQVVVEVEDTGAGMSQETIARIFEPFFTTKDVGEGTGLGLSVAFGIVGEQGGRIEVKSQIGRGSIFSVYLPLEAEA